MKREIGLLLTSMMFAGVMGSGCVVHHRDVVVARPPAVGAPSAEVIVTTEPPAPRHEVIGIAPSARHVWVEGYWTHHEGRWNWNSGHWELRPRRGAVWVAGHWDRTPRGWVWRPGRWA